MEQFMKTTTLLVSALALAFMFTTAMAQTDTKAPSKAHTSLSAQCSKQATDKGLTGKERKAFYIKCTKATAAKKAPKAKASKVKTSKAKPA